MILPLANVLQPLITFTEGVMKFWHDKVGFSWGMSIILLTVVIRLIILPLTFKQVKSMQEMKRIQPELQKLKERYKDDKQRQQQEQMKLFQEHGVNPLSSCLPIALQFPFFISLFYMLRHDLRLDVCGSAITAYQRLHPHATGTPPCGQLPGTHGEQFLFIHDITDKATGAALITLIVLYIGSQMISGLITTFAADRSQQIIMLALPLVFVTLIINFPAGLIVYWITTNIWTIGQQLVIKRLVPTPAEPALAGAAAITGRPARGKPAAEKPATDGQAAAEPAPKQKSKAKAKAESGSNGADASKVPPPGPRKKKKRSGRRR
jgi:YidC/Oxa1 family membrane protein insertase